MVVCFVCVHVCVCVGHLPDNGELSTLSGAAIFLSNSVFRNSVIPYSVILYPAFRRLPCVCVCVCFVSALIFVCVCVCACVLCLH